MTNSQQPLNNVQNKNGVQNTSQPNQQQQKKQFTK